MKKISLKLLLLFVFCCSFSRATEIDKNVANALLLSRFDVGYSFGQFIGIRQKYAEMGLFLPFLLKERSSSFVDIRGYRFNNSKWGLSSGIGFRNKISCSYVVGTHLYFDFLQGKFNKTFNRIGLGAECFGSYFDFRFNAYFPFGSHQQFSKRYAFKYPGGYRATCRESQFSISQGFDAEVGKCFWRCEEVNFYAAMGPYFYSSKYESSYCGGYARIELSYSSMICFQVKGSYDRMNRSQVQGQIQICFPFEIISKKISAICENLMLQPIRRNGIIFTRDCCDYTWNW